MIMRKLLLAFIILFTAVSCLDDAFSTSYVANASFDYYDAEFGDDSLFFDTKYKLGITWDYLAFYHKVDEKSSEFRGGFIMSCLSTPESGKTDDLTNNQYRANVRVPKSVKNKYAVFCQTSDMPADHMQFAFQSSSDMMATCAMQAVFVTNTVAVEKSIKETFVPGDQLILRATGYLADQKTDVAEIKLAEYTTNKDSVVTAWTVFDLSKLGSVDKVRFEIEGPAGKDIPTAVCMDNMLAKISIKEE